MLSDPRSCKIGLYWGGGGAELCWTPAGPCSPDDAPELAFRNGKNTPTRLEDGGGGAEPMRADREPVDRQWTIAACGRGRGLLLALLL